MADFMESEAVVDSDENLSDDETASSQQKPKKKMRRQLSSDEDEDEEEDEERAREDMKGFIADEEEIEEEESNNSGSDSDDKEGRRRKKKRRKRRSRSRSVEENLDDEDMELLEENLGIKIQKKRKRIRMGSEESDEGSDHHSDHSESEQRQQASDVEELPDVETRRFRRPGVDSEDEAAIAMEDDEDDGFIVDEDGVPIKRKKRKKKTHIFEDSARQLAEDIFGVAFDYEEFADNDEGGDQDSDNDDYDDDEDLDDNEIERRRQKKLKKRKKKSAKSIFEIFEPRELELRHFTDLDNEIRNTDIPERMQLRSIPITPVSEGSDELDREAEWIFKYGFTKMTVSRQDGFTREECTDWSRKEGTIEKIKKALDFMRQQFYEVPFIAFYRKEYVEPELKINDLWRVYFMDEKWCKLQNRKRNLRKLFEKMQRWQGDQLMADMNKPIPEGMRILSKEDIEKIDVLESHEEIKDVDTFFKLYYSKDLEAMTNAIKDKKREEREALKLQKSKKTKVTRNDDGEEVEVTDHESEEEDETETLKTATRNDPYLLCLKYNIIGFSKRFGLSPEQFAENLRDGYQKHDIEQEPSRPIDVAEEYLNDKFPKSEDVLSAVKFIVATQLSREPLVRHVTREVFYDRATLTIVPTKKGITEIDESHDCYSMKYLKNKPVRTLSGIQWLHLTAAEDQKLIKIDLANDIPSLTGLGRRSHLEEAQDLYKYDGFSSTITEWNDLRAEAVEMAFKKMLYPMLRNELRLKLTREAKEGVLRQCKNKLYDWLKTSKYTVSFDDEDEDDWDSSSGCRILGLMYEDDVDIAAYAVVIGIDGEVNDFLKCQHLLKRKNAWNEKEKMEKENDLKNLKAFIVQKKPHAIVVGAVDRMAIMVKEDLENIISELVSSEHQFPRIGVFLMDDNLAKVFANSTRAETDFRDYPNILRQAISLARRLQDPLIEFSQLTGPENEILCLNYHSLQNLLDDEELLNALNIELINRTNEVGVDVNECVLHPHTCNIVQFIGGLGPRKGAALLKTLRQLQSSQRLENRQQLVTLCHMGPKVLINCAGFIKIDTTSLGDSEVYVEVLDGSRIHNEAYEWARKMAVDALEYDEEDGNPANALEEILNDPEKLAELDLDAFAQELERQGFGNKSITLYDIRAELYQMYKDLREPYVSPDAEEIFNLVTKESPSTFYIGKLVTVTVTGFAHKKPQGEELDQAAPLRKGENQWQCPFCGQDDFPELTEVWNHFDAGTCPGKAVGVRVRLDNGVSGFIPIKNLSDKTVINPEERVRVKQSLFARITKIQPERFSIECICKSSALIDKDCEWKPAKDEYYDNAAQVRDVENNSEKKKAQQRQIYTKRVIVHPSFYNIGYKEAEKLMVDMDQGDVIIRPSSKGENRLTVTWKVTDSIYEHIDVREDGKLNSFSLGQSLWIGTEEFEDLDEIIARHINPIASHARDILNFKYCKDTNGGKRDVAEEMLRNDKKAAPNKIHYFLSPSKAYPGKFMLSYMPRNEARHEFITLTPDGFRFRKLIFDSLSSLIKWFKEHFRDPIPGTPATPGRLTSRTPYTMTGTPRASITPGAMSLATGTPYGTTPFGGGATNTPYTPSGQTPFMTPYQTPGPSSTHGTPSSRSSYAPGSRTPHGSTPLENRSVSLSRSSRPFPGASSSSRPPRGRPSPNHSDRNTSGGSWQAALDAWPGGTKGNFRRTLRPDNGSNTSRSFDVGHQRSSKYGATTPEVSSKRPHKKMVADTTPLYDE